MEFSLEQTKAILHRTPHTMRSLLYDLDQRWTHRNEGGDTWSPYDVIGHLVHCEEENWIPRVKVFLSDSEVRAFHPLDRFAQFKKYKDSNMNQLLDDFASRRAASMAELNSYRLDHESLSKTAIHPELGQVTLSQLIATWAVHDLDHLSQISRVMATQYRVEIGPWVQYMRVLSQNK